MLNRRNLIKSAAGLLVAAGAGELLLPDRRVWALDRTMVSQATDWLPLGEGEVWPYFDSESAGFQKVPVKMVWKWSNGTVIETPFTGFDQEMEIGHPQTLLRFDYSALDYATVQAQKAPPYTALYVYRKEWHGPTPFQYVVTSGVPNE